MVVLHREPATLPAATEPPTDSGDASVVVFYHVYATGDWNAVVRDQVSGSYTSALTLINR